MRFLTFIKKWLGGSEALQESLGGVRGPAWGIRGPARGTWSGGRREDWGPVSSHLEERERETPRGRLLLWEFLIGEYLDLQNIHYVTLQCKTDGLRVRKECSVSCILVLYTRPPPRKHRTPIWWNFKPHTTKNNRIFSVIENHSLYLQTWRDLDPPPRDPGQSRLSDASRCPFCSI